MKAKIHRVDIAGQVVFTWALTRDGAVRDAAEALTADAEARAATGEELFAAGRDGIEIRNEGKYRRVVDPKSAGLAARDGWRADMTASTDKPLEAVADLIAIARQVARFRGASMDYLFEHLDDLIDQADAALSRTARDDGGERSALAGDAREQGRQAFAAGLSRSECPYDDDPSHAGSFGGSNHDRHEWGAGYDEAARDDRADGREDVHVGMSEFQRIEEQERNAAARRMIEAAATSPEREAKGDGAMECTCATSGKAWVCPACHRKWLTSNAAPDAAAGDSR